MAAGDHVANVLAGAKDTLARANKFTESVEGNPTSAFAPKKMAAPKIPQAHEYSHAPYHMAAPSGGDKEFMGIKGNESEGINARREMGKGPSVE